VRLLERAELVLHGGDFVTARFFEELRAIGPPVEGVSVNMDEPALKESQHLWVLNPGSPTERRSAPVHSMIVLTVKGRRITPELVTL